MNHGGAVAWARRAHGPPKILVGWATMHFAPTIIGLYVREFPGKLLKLHGATKCQLLRLKCTKFAYRWGSAPNPVEGAYSAPPDGSSIAVFKGPTSKGK